MKVNSVADTVNGVITVVKEGFSKQIHFIKESILKYNRTGSITVFVTSKIWFISSSNKQRKLRENREMGLDSQEINWMLYG